MGKLLVTGGDGMVGHALRKLNPEDAIFISRRDVDLTKFDDTLELFKTIHPEFIIHLAARVAGLAGNMSHHGDLYRDNILVNTNVLECARLVKVEKLLSFLSTCAYPVNIDHALKEEFLHDGSPNPGNFAYSYAKRMLDVQSRAYRKQWGCDFITVIPSNMYGPYDNWNLEEGHVISALIHKCYIAKQYHQDLVAWGSGSPLREFVIADDAARLALWALKNYENENPINFSPGTEVRIKDLVVLVTSAIGFKGEVVWDTSKPDGQYRKPTDNSKLREYLPNFRFTPIEEGIGRTVQWFLNNYPNVRK